MIQGKIVQMVLKLVLPQLIKHPIIKGLIKYKEEPNDVDIKVRDLEKKITDIGFKATATIDMVKKDAESIDIISEKVKSFEKITHPPAIDLKEWQDVKDAVKKMKKLRVFKSLGKK